MKDVLEFNNLDEPFVLLTLLLGQLLLDVDLLFINRLPDLCKGELLQLEHVVVQNLGKDFIVKVRQFPELN